MKYTVYRDQAVWERETLEVEIPDDTPKDEIEEAIHAKIAADEFKTLLNPQILNSVESFDTVIEIQFDHE